MHDKQKIIIMSRLAAYEKNYAKEDRKKAEYFRHDYVYRRNMAVRFFAFIGSLIIILIYFTHRIVIGSLDIMDVTGDVVMDLIYAGAFILLVQLVYSVIGYFIYTYEYNEAQGRIDEYFNDINRLTRRNEVLGQRHEERLARQAREDFTRHYGSDTKDDIND